MNRVDDTMLDTIPKDLQLNGTNYIVYNESAPLPDAYDVDSIDDYLDDFYLKPLNKEKLWMMLIILSPLMCKWTNLGNGVNYAFLITSLT